MKPSFSSFLIFLLLAMPSASQDDCTYEPSSKVQKLLDQSYETKKHDTNERIAFLEKALDEDPKCLPCLRRIGEIEFLVAKRGGSFATAQRYLEQLVELCPEYHSEPYYFLGAMSYGDHDYQKAEQYFEKFLRFPDSDPTKFEKDYAKKYEEVEEALKSVKAYAEIYSDKIEFTPLKVQGVSSGEDDYLPMISPDGEVMFFTRTAYKQAKGDYVSRRVEEFSWAHRPDINSTFDFGKPLPRPFNQGNNCGGATISVDNRELIVAMKNPVPKNPNNIDLFSTKYAMAMNDIGINEYQWSELENLGPSINTEDGFEGQPSLSGDGKTLFFVAVRPECMIDSTTGEFSHDIFFSQRQADGSWSQCRPLPSEVNTMNQEKGPFMHSDSHTLYFASDGHFGLGKMDIYYCHMKGDGTFSEPKNIGYPINSEADELGIVVTSDGELAYFGAQNFRNNKGWDIYQFDMPEKAKPEKVMVLKGQVKNEEGEPAQNATVEITYTESKEKEKIAVNNDDGSYATIVRIERNENVTLSIEGDGIAFNSRLVAKKDVPAPVVTRLNMETAQAGEGKPFLIHDIFYETSSAEIEEESKIILDAFAEYLLENPTMDIEISGHTDNVGDDAANMALSAERAFEVLNYLAAKGVPSKRITSKGYGEGKPVADNNTEEGRARNRRTEFLVRKM